MQTLVLQFRTGGHSTLESFSLAPSLRSFMHSLLLIVCSCRGHLLLAACGGCEERLALAHHHVLLQKEQCQKGRNHHPIRGGTCPANPVDLNGTMDNSKPIRRKETTRLFITIYSSENAKGVLSGSLNACEGQGGAPYHDHILYILYIQYINWSCL